MFVLLICHLNQSINVFLQTFHFTLTFNNFFGWTIKVTLACRRGKDAETRFNSLQFIV